MARLYGRWMLLLVGTTAGVATVLRPQTNEKRLSLSLNGAAWALRVRNHVVPIAVPASYNDLVIGYAMAHDFAGTVSYVRADVIVPDEWAESKRIVLRIGSASYASWAVINGARVGDVHRGLGMPFEIDVSTALRFGSDGPNNITICVNNERSWSTLPPGYTSTYYEQKVNLYWDGLYDYAGLDGRVHLVATPPADTGCGHIDDVDLWVDVHDEPAVARRAGRGRASGRYRALGTATVHYRVSTTAESDRSCTVEVSLSDAENPKTIVETATGAPGAAGALAPIKDACLWEALPGVPCLYLATVKLIDGATKTLHDVYRLKIGLREIAIENGDLLLNGRKLYLRGIHAHAEAALRGRGRDAVLAVRDVSLMVSLGVNWVRIHPPPSESMLDLLDEAGILMNAEVPAIGLRPPPAPLLPGGDGGAAPAFSPSRINATTLAAHVAAVREYIERDKNRASVLLWSLANEPATDESGSVDYFAALFNASRGLDPQKRPMTYVTNRAAANDLAAGFGDVICANRYFGWYFDKDQSYFPVPPNAALPPAAGYQPRPVAAVGEALKDDLRQWRAKYPGKPLLVSEYGAGMLPGHHAAPADMYSAEYQREVLEAYWDAFDALRAGGANATIQGEGLHALHDFRQHSFSPHDVAGMNWKGVYDRSRQPKDGGVVRALRKRYDGLAEEVVFCV